MQTITKPIELQKLHVYVIFLWPCIIIFQMQNSNSNEFDFGNSFPIFLALEQIRSVEYESISSKKSQSSQKQENQNENKQEDSEICVDQINPPVKSCHREVWTAKEQLKFFKFLGQSMLQDIDSFRNWQTINKKGIFNDMASNLKTKNANQCKLKYNTFKRKHSNINKPQYYFPCMRMLIIKKLQEQASQSKKCQVILKSIKSQQDQMDQMEKKLAKDIQDNERQNEFIKELHNFVFAKAQKKEDGKAYVKIGQQEKTQSQTLKYLDKRLKDVLAANRAGAQITYNL